MVRMAATSMPVRVVVITCRPLTVLAEARNCLASPRDASAFSLSSAWRSCFISLACCSMRSSSPAGAVFRNCAALCSTPWLRSMPCRLSLPQVASIRRTPEATLVSDFTRKGPAFAVLSTWVPPQNSMDTSPISTTRTVSPYFSPNIATAPFFLASSMGSTSVTTG